MGTSNARPEPKSPTEALDVQRKIADTLAGRRPVESNYPYFPPDYQIPYLHIGTDKQILLDNFILDHFIDVKRVIAQPKKTTDAVLPVGDLPWEGIHHPIAQTALFDPDDQKFKLWYNQPLSNDGYGDQGMALCYAESTDGLHWEKPLSTECLPYNGHTATNIVLEDSGHHIALVLNQDRSDPARKFLLKYNPGGRARQLGRRVMSTNLVSADGIRWTEVSEDTPYRHHHLSRPIWDDALNKWVAYSQYSHHWNLLYRKRQIGRQESDDFINWSPKEVTLSADWEATLPPHIEFHDMSARKLGGLYIGIVTEFMSEPLWMVQRDFDWNDHAHMQFSLYTSRDGRHWTRACGPDGWVPNGPPGSLDYGALNFSVSDQLTHNGQTIVLYSAHSTKQHWFGRKPNARPADQALFETHARAWQQLPDHAVADRRDICALLLREDGWAELRPTYEHGQVVTRQFVFEGDSLKVNADTRGGYVQVEVLDPSFQPYPGFSAETCLPLHTDDPQQIWHTVRWQGDPDLRTLWNKPVRLVFHLHQASLYAFQFTPTP